MTEIRRNSQSYLLQQSQHDAQHEEEEASKAPSRKCMGEVTGGGCKKEGDRLLDYGITFRPDADSSLNI